jgi:hypothetical protein
MGGVLHSEVASALYGHPDAPPVLNSFIGGLGGRDISAEEFYEMASVTARAAVEGRSLPPRLLFTGRELAEVRRLRQSRGQNGKTLKTRINRDEGDTGDNTRNQTLIGVLKKQIQVFLTGC